MRGASSATKRRSRHCVLPALLLLSGCFDQPPHERTNPETSAEAEYYMLAAVLDSSCFEAIRSTGSMHTTMLIGWVYHNPERPT